MKKIGFIDYFLSEWHANNYPKWIEENCCATNRDYKVCYAYSELEVSPYDNVTTNEWCQKFGVTRCNTIEELCEKSDYIIILSPDNPERHLDYAKLAFPCGKPCYMDKTFAPSLTVAKQIFELADKYNVKLFSTSALRFAKEIQKYNNAYSVVTNGGVNIKNYLVHQAEIVVRTMGIGAEWVMVTNIGHNSNLTIGYKDNRRAVINITNSGRRFSADIVPTADSQKADCCDITIPFFPVLIDEILNMFHTGEIPFDRSQTLEVMAIIDAAKIGATQLDTKIKIQK